VSRINMQSTRRHPPGLSDRPVGNCLRKCGHHRLSRGNRDNLLFLETRGGMKRIEAQGTGDILSRISLMVFS
jgi:hypothetical protein